jgi:hypothetical protein
MAAVCHGGGEGSGFSFTAGVLSDSPASFISRDGIGQSWVIPFPRMGGAASGKKVNNE